MEKKKETKGLLGGIVDRVMGEVGKRFDVADRRMARIEKDIAEIKKDIAEIKRKLSGR